MTEFTFLKTYSTQWFDTRVHNKVTYITSRQTALVVLEHPERWKDDKSSDVELIEMSKFDKNFGVLQDSG